MRLLFLVLPFAALIGLWGMFFLVVEGGRRGVRAMLRPAEPTPSPLATLTPPALPTAAMPMPPMPTGPTPAAAMPVAPTALPDAPPAPVGDAPATVEDLPVRLALLREGYRVMLLGRPWPVGHPLAHLVDAEAKRLCRDVGLPDGPASWQLPIDHFLTMVHAAATAAGEPAAADATHANALHDDWVAHGRASTVGTDRPLRALLDWLESPEGARVREDWAGLGPFT